MRFSDTEEMKDLKKKFEPYILKHFSISKDAPSDAKKAYEEYNKLFEEQFELEMSMW